MIQYICKFSKDFKVRNSNTCSTCLHNYPHKHTKDCNGQHCENSNPKYYDQKTMKELLTCQPIKNLKGTKKVKENIRAAIRAEEFRKNREEIDVC